MIAAPLVLLLSLAWALTQAHQVGHWQSTIQGALSGVATVAAGQIIGTVLKLWRH